MVSYDAAVEILQKKAVSLQSPNERDGKQIWEEVYLMDAVGRVAATEVVSPTATPQFDTHAMDGVRDDRCRRWAYGAGWMRFRGAVEPCLEIMTGRHLPQGCGHDEAVRRVRARRRHRRGIRCRYDGTDDHDHKAGAVGCEPQARRVRHPARGADRQRGDVLSSSHIMPLASVGVSKIRVFKKPRVAVWSTGKALMAGEASNIPDVNGPFLVAALREAGAQPTFLGTLHDNEDAVMGALRDTIDGGLFGLVLTTGGVSVGKFDFVASSLGALGAKTHFHGVAMRPGHPVLFAQVPGLSHDLPFFGLLGNAGATAACFRFLVVPFLRSWQHQTAETPIMAECVEDTSTDSREAASPGIPRMTSSRHGIMQQGKNGDVLVEFSKQQSPAKLGPFINANCWVRLGGQSQGSRREGRVACFYMPVHATV
ncbi:putative molybdopterin biosynthesis protein [Colletotrichum sublineola]|uniref:molybdopterin adenylyltransferase n=1 Tax=Colletotrichum sublineola TaxID=1173701 RepID=A0A066XUI7_COLSU|nr:putative molybdopterin biosynthesis protein [Colletotrichum sublineola]